jgi:hypothetical protein
MNPKMAEEEDTLLKSIADDIKSESGAKEELKKEESEETSEETSEEEDTEEADEEGLDSEDEGEEEDIAPTRGQTRQQRLANEKKELKAALSKEREDREKLIAELATERANKEFVKQQQSASQSESYRRAEEERLSLLTEDQKAAYLANKKADALEYRLNQMEMQRQDDRDRADFHAKASHDSVHQKYADVVEQMYQDGLRKGVSAPRSEYLAMVIGREILKDKDKKLSERKESASKRIDAVTSKPAKARGDVSGSKKGKTEEDRLRGVLI